MKNSSLSCWPWKETYQPKPFEPPFWAKDKYYRRRFETPDGDFFDVDIVDGKHQTSPYVVVCHGLESSSHSHHTLRIVESIASLGWNVFAMNYRGCSGEPNRTLKTYHLGFTEDLNQLTKIILEETKGDAEIYLAGFSLGGNLIIKFLGELGEEAVQRRIIGAVVFCVPLNPLYSQPNADKGLSKWLYVSRFLTSFRKKMEEQYQRFPEAFNRDKLIHATTIAELDDYYISPIFGFKGKEDYYRQCGGEAFLFQVRAFLLVVNAKNDPIVDTESLPTEDSIKNDWVKLVYTQDGGHCGYFNGFYHKSYLAEEIARFLNFLHEHF
eukprot:jgi/Galph1/5795/GphlegSOOS_G4502.1